MYQCCGQPWRQMTTSSPSPASATWNSIPRARTCRWPTPSTSGGALIRSGDRGAGAGAAEVVDDLLHRRDVTGDVLRPGPDRLLAERLQAVAADHDHGGVVGPDHTALGELHRRRHGGAAGRLGEDALG